jgi:hypothetical protein
LETQRKRKQVASTGRSRSRPHAATEKPSLVPGPPPPDIAPELTAKQAARKASVSLQQSDKRGKRSTAQKRASSRHGFDAIPATRPAAGAFGKEPASRRGRKAGG